MAELRIAETQAKDVSLNQPAHIDTHNGIVAGHVTRIDPSVQNGTVTVDVTLDGPLPPGARPDLSVEGTIDLERLSNALYVGRPVLLHENGNTGLFVMQANGIAVRTQVRVERWAAHLRSLAQHRAIAQLLRYGSSLRYLAVTPRGNAGRCWS